MKIAVVLTTRGLVFTEVENAIEKMREKYNIVVFRSWDLGIPDSQNTLVEEALKISPDYIFFIEEDTIPPDGAIDALLAVNADVAFIDYAINGWACAAKFTDGEILWCGLGCTLVKREVFEALEKPYFRTDKSLSLNTETYFQWLDTPNKYGGQDIWFFSQVRAKGFTLKQVAGECRHMRIDALGRPGVNNGRHILMQKPIIAHEAIYDRPLTNDLLLHNNMSIGDSSTGN